jgi:hypothetical protein
MVTLGGQRNIYRRGPVSDRWETRYQYEKFSLAGFAEKLRLNFVAEKTTDVFGTTSACPRGRAQLPFVALIHTLHRPYYRPLDVRKARPPLLC